MANQIEQTPLSPSGTDHSGGGEVVLRAKPVPQYRQFRLFIFVLLMSLVAYWLISHFVLMTVEIQGASMSPTLLDGQRYLLLRCPYLWRQPKTGEIVVLRDPEDH